MTSEEPTTDIVPWAAQLQAAISVSTERSYAQLSTIRGPSSGRYEGRPACRTVNIRSFHQGKLYFVSDLRSGKANDIQEGQSGFAEICWYFPQTKIQFRISGVLDFHHNDNTSADTWASLTYSERKWWAWPHPGATRALKNAFREPASEVAPKHFCVFRLDADYVDLLDLTQAPFMREIHVLEKGWIKTEKMGEWTAKRVNP